MSGDDSDQIISIGDAQRAGRREANLRALNSRIVESQEQIAVALESQLTILCECASIECNESIEISRETFASLEDESTRFMIVEGHQLHDVEQVVGQGDGWVIVEKRGPAAREARRILE